MRSQTGAVKLQDAAGATADGTAMQVAGYDSVVFQITGTFSATVTFEGSVDGTTWVEVACADLNSTTRARAKTATAAGLFLLDGIAGLALFRARVSAWASGSVTVVANASA